MGMVPLNKEPDGAVFAIARTADNVAALAINHALITESCHFTRTPKSVPSHLGHQCSNPWRRNNPASKCLLATRWRHA